MASSQFYNVFVGCGGGPIKARSKAFSTALSLAIKEACARGILFSVSTDWKNGEISARIYSSDDGEIPIYSIEHGPLISYQVTAFVEGSDVPLDRSGFVSLPGRPGVDGWITFQRRCVINRGALMGRSVHVVKVGGIIAETHDISQSYELKLQEFCQELLLQGPDYPHHIPGDIVTRLVSKPAESCVVVYCEFGVPKFAKKYV